jgi:hypothetical protein
MVSCDHKEDLEQTKKLILNITNNSNYSWKRIEESEERDNIHIKKRYELLIDFLIFQDSHVMKLLEKNKFEPLNKEKRYRVFLPPIEGTECLPLLTFKWDHYGQNWEWKFILDIAKSYDEIFSLRFETQHSDGGTHSHLHMQINNKIFGSDRCEGGYKLKWLPGDHPHLLIRSDKHPKSPIILLVYLLGSLYGFKDAKKNFFDGIDPRYMNDMKVYFS